MPNSREIICRQTAARLQAAAAQLQGQRALVGLDGFVDEIIAVVDKRHDFQRFEPIRTIEQFARKIADAAGQSSNYELVLKQVKLGGNGPIMANALASLGLPLTYLGCLGQPTIHPVFGELARRAQVLSVAEPGHTAALEFEDGKLMLGKHAALANLSWDSLLATLGLERIVELFQSVALIAMVNWTMMPHMTDIWQHLLSEVVPRLAGRKHLFVDLADPEKRTAADIRTALDLLTAFQHTMDVTLGLNMKEAIRVAQVLGLDLPLPAEAALAETAQAIRQQLAIDCVVVHPRAAAAAATASESAVFAGPFVQHPRISTGAGDHFNAGFAAARLAGLELVESLCAGTAASGYYVQTAASPTIAELAGFVARLPLPEPF